MSFPRLRVGWIACQDLNLLRKIADSKHYLSICNSGPSEILALIALRNRESILARNRQLIAENLAAIASFLQRWPMFSWTAPRGGCTGFMKLDSSAFVVAASSTAETVPVMMTAAGLAERVVQSHGVLLLPGDFFPSARTSPGRTSTSQHFRFGFGRRNFQECLAVFELALASL